VIYTESTEKQRKNNAKQRKMVYQCHKCKKEFIQKTDHRRHLNRTIDCMNIPIEDRIVTKVLDKLKDELKNGNITPNMNIDIQEINPVALANEAEVVLQENLEEQIKREKWAEMTIVQVQAKMKETNIPDLTYKSGKNKGEVNKNRNATLTHCLKWAKNNTEEKEEKEPDEIGINVSSEDLREMIHEIHNFLRNGGIGYGIAALKIFNLMYGLKKIEKYNLFDKIKLNKACKFSVLAKLARSGVDICDLFNKEYLGHLHDSIVQTFLMEELPDHIKEKDLRHLVIEIDNLVELECRSGEQLSGKVYEYFIGRDESAISELGAYFTNRLIVNYIYALVDPCLSLEGEVESMIDTFGGSGGFTGGYIIHLDSKPQKPNWKTDLKNVWHIDMNNDVVKYAGMEFMCLTKEVPVMGANGSLRCENSFTYEFEQQFKFIFTNPPYGGDKNKKYGSRLKYDVMCSYLKDLVKPINDIVDNNKKAVKGIKGFKEIEISKEQLLLKEHYDNQIKVCVAYERSYTGKFEKSKVSLANSSNFIRTYADKHKLTANDKEGVSLILMMALLAPGGTAVGVLKEGVFFDKSYKGLREHLLTHFNVLKVISIPQNMFENTATKTSIVIFKNEIPLEPAGEENPQTTQVEFRTLNVLLHDENKFEWDDIAHKFSMDAVAGEIRGVEDPVTAHATYQELKANSWGLDAKKYNVKQLIPGDGFKLVKLGDIADIKYGTRIVKSNNTVGDIPVYGGGDITFYTNKHNRDDKTLVVSRYALSKECVRIVRGQFYLNDSGMSLHCKEVSNQKYLSYYMVNPRVQYLIVDGYTRGSIQKNVDVNSFKTLQIPVPVDPEVTAAWVERISAPYDLARQMEVQLKQLEQEVSDEIRRITEEEDCEEFKLGDLCELVDGYDFYKKDLSNTYQPNENIPVIKNGTSTTTYAENLDKYKKYRCKKNDILICTMGTICVKINTFDLAYHGHHIYRVVKKQIIGDMYLYHYIHFIINDIKEKSRGSVIKGVSKNTLQETIIKIPNNKSLIEALEVKFQLIEQCKETSRNTEEQFKNLIEELGNAALKK
jgi:type I restriction-modification system DNA methylase subunit